MGLPATPGPDPHSCPLQPLLSLENSVTTRFADTGDARVTVQAACGSSVLQDSKVVRVLGESPCLGRQRVSSFAGAPGLGDGGTVSRRHLVMLGSRRLERGACEHSPDAPRLLGLSFPVCKRNTDMCLCPWLVLMGLTQHRRGHG